MNLRKMILQDEGIGFNYTEQHCREHVILCRKLLHELQVEEKQTLKFIVECVAVSFLVCVIIESSVLRV